MFIKQEELFDGISADARGVIERHKTKQIYREEEPVFQEGEEAHYFYMLEDGKVDLVVGEPRETRFLAYYPGEIFGWSALVKPHRYLAQARCMTQSTISRVPVEAIIRIIKDYPSDGVLIYRNLSGILGQRLIAAYRDRQAEPEVAAYGG
ncbi:MAG: cyclic nucleotide-binding domain-containing protein [Syntrophorhabdales bacterium]|jgi:CRP-like cAMP-binding protein